MNQESRVSIEYVLQELNLSKMPTPQGLELLLSYVETKDLMIYTDESMLGTDASDGYEMVYDHEGNVTDALIANGESEIHEQAKVIKTAVLSRREADYGFLVYEYLVDGQSYYPTEETGMFLRSVFFPLERFYIYEDEMRKVKEQIGIVDNAKNALKNAQKGEPGVRKALALLAREKAEISTKFRKGANQVNASAFKEHILNLANKYIDLDDVEPEGNLKSLDDKISQSLDQYELKEIPPTKKS